MPELEVTLPPLGANAPDEATVSFFLVGEGDQVKKDDDFCEMLTDKATFTVHCPADGRISKLVVKENEVVPVGGVLAIMEV